MFTPNPASLDVILSGANALFVRLRYPNIARWHITEKNNTLILFV